MRLAQTSGKPITHVARDLGISDTSIHQWRKESWQNIARRPSQAVGISHLKKKKSVASSASWKWWLLDITASRRTQHDGNILRRAMELELLQQGPGRLSSFPRDAQRV
ncbi:MAG: hypothetical protein H0V70_21085 [Ktedonobacteraceae bacterium]|nr:hypothetical protein [Ktedonobacteraceae bacterium]